MPELDDAQWGLLAKIIGKHLKEPSTLLHRLASNASVHEKNHRHHDITEDEYQHLYDILLEEKECFLVGWIEFLRRQCFPRVPRVSRVSRAAVTCHDQQQQTDEPVEKQQTSEQQAEEPGKQQHEEPEKQPHEELEKQQHEEQAEQTAEQTAGQAEQTAEQTAGQAEQTAEQTAEQAEQTAEQTAGQAEQTAEQTAGQAEQTAKQASLERFSRQSPDELPKCTSETTNDTRAPTLTLGPMKPKQPMELFKETALPVTGDTKDDGIGQRTIIKKKIEFRDIYLDKKNLETLIGTLKDANKKPMCEEKIKQYKQIISPYLDESSGLHVRKAIDQSLQDTIKGKDKLDKRLHKFLTVVKILCNSKSLGILQEESEALLSMAIAVARASLARNVQMDTPLTTAIALSWNDIVFAVREVSDEMINSIAKDIPLDISLLESIIRMRLYVFDCPPRKDEYRTLLFTKPPGDQARTANWFDSEHDKIVLNDFSLVLHYGTQELEITAPTATFIRELQNVSNQKYIFRGDDGSKDMPISSAEWEQCIIRDFRRIKFIGNHNITPRLLRSLYLCDNDVIHQMNDIHTRFKIMKDMGHCLVEHIHICNERVNKKRKANEVERESSSPKKLARPTAIPNF